MFTGKNLKRKVRKDLAKGRKEGVQNKRNPIFAALCEIFAFFAVIFLRDVTFNRRLRRIHRRDN